MNIEHIDRVIAAIRMEQEVKLRGETVGFNMTNWIHEADDGDPDHEDKTGHQCGTVACIAGICAILAGKPDTFLKASVGAKYLGINDVAAGELFRADRLDRPLEEITPDEAVATLEHLKATGMVDWVREGDSWTAFDATLIGEAVR